MSLFKSVASFIATVFLIMGISLFLGLDVTAGMVTEYSKTDREITSKVGRRFVIALPAIGTAGYDWECRFDKTRLHLIKRESTSGSGVGAEVNWRFIFEALQEGDTTIQMNYKRSWESSVEEQYIFSVHIE